VEGEGLEERDVEARIDLTPPAQSKDKKTIEQILHPNWHNQIVRFEHPAEVRGDLTQSDAFLDHEGVGSKLKLGSYEIERLLVDRGIDRRLKSLLSLHLKAMIEFTPEEDRYTAEPQLLAQCFESLREDGVLFVDR
jgi:hypothetical protein